MTTTGAQDVAGGLLSILNTFKAANPTLLHRTRATRPGQFGEFPLAFIEIGPETIEHDSGTRQRRFSPTVTVVDTFSEDGDRLNVIRDGLIDAFTAGVSVVSGIVIRMTACAPAEETLTNPVSGAITVYPALIFSFAEIWLAEGRN